MPVVLVRPIAELHAPESERVGKFFRRHVFSAAIVTADARLVVAVEIHELLPLFLGFLRLRFQLAAVLFQKIFRFFSRGKAFREIQGIIVLGFFCRRLVQHDAISEMPVAKVRPYRQQGLRDALLSGFLRFFFRQFAVDGFVDLAAIFVERAFRFFHARIFQAGGDPFPREGVEVNDFQLAVFFHFFHFCRDRAVQRLFGMFFVLFPYEFVRFFPRLEYGRVPSRDGGNRDRPPTDSFVDGVFSYVSEQMARVARGGIGIGDLCKIYDGIHRLFKCFRTNIVNFLSVLVEQLVGAIHAVGEDLRHRHVRVASRSVSQPVVRFFEHGNVVDRVRSAVERLAVIPLFQLALPLLRFFHVEGLCGCRALDQHVTRLRHGKQRFQQFYSGISVFSPLLDF